MRSELFIGNTYPTDGSSYECIGVNDDFYTLRRATDHWTLNAYGCRFDKDGNLFWSYSGGGHWPLTKYVQRLYFYLKTGTYDKVDKEYAHWSYTDKYTSKKALLEHFRKIRTGEQISEILTAEQVFALPAERAALIIRKSFQYSN